MRNGDSRNPAPTIAFVREHPLNAVLPDQPFESEIQRHLPCLAKLLELLLNGGKRLRLQGLTDQDPADRVADQGAHRDSKKLMGKYFGAFEVAGKSIERRDVGKQQIVLAVEGA